MDETKYNIAVIGAGPAGLYAAQRLANDGHAVSVFNRDIKHGGLAEFGIYLNKYKMKKGLRKVFRSILEDDRVSYFGHVNVGADADISLDDLREMGFDALVVSVGAQGTKWLGLPGEDLRQVYHAKDVVYHYNGLPPFSENEFPVGQHVCVVGLGNVCLDIVHWLVCEVKCRDVTIVGRRGPAERQYTKKEMKLIGGAMDESAVRGDIAAHAEQLTAVGQDPDKLAEEIAAYSGAALEVESPTKFTMKFLCSPVEIVGADGAASGLRCEKTELALRENGSTRAVGTGEFETIPCDAVVFAIGDSIEPSIGLPLEPEWKSTFMTVPTPWEEQPDRDRYMVFDPAKNEPIWDCFVLGWARKASDGLVGKARADAIKGCDEVFAYLAGGFEQQPAPPKKATDVLHTVEAELRRRNVEFVTWPDVLRLMAAEDKVAEERELPEFKFTTTTDLLAAIREIRQ